MRSRNLLGIMLGLLISAWAGCLAAQDRHTVPAAANFPTPGRQTVPFGVPLAPPDLLRQLPVPLLRESSNGRADARLSGAAAATGLRLPARQSRWLPLRADGAIFPVAGRRESRSRHGYGVALLLSDDGTMARPGAAAVSERRPDQFTPVSSISPPRRVTRSSSRFRATARI